MSGFSTSLKRVYDLIATKLPLAGGTLTGNLTISSDIPKIELDDVNAASGISAYSFDVESAKVSIKNRNKVNGTITRMYEISALTTHRFYASNQERFSINHQFITFRRPLRFYDSGAEMAEPTGAAPLFSARAWVNFDGTGVPAIRAAGNVSSITDLGTGNYRINFSTPMPDANYAAVGGLGDHSNARVGMRQLNAGVQTTHFDVEVLEGNADIDQVHLAFLR